MPAVKEEKENSKLEAALAAIEKQFGKEAIMSKDKIHGVEFTSSGSIALDKALGGGWPKGRIVEIFGPESSGKSTLCLHAAAEVQKIGGVVAYIDVEHALDIKYAEALGVDMDLLLMSQPSSAEEALEIVDILTRSGEVALIIVDSVAALVPEKELEGNMGDSNMGKHALLMSQAMRKLTGISAKSNTTIIFINQLRMKIGVMFGNPETTTGGNALKFYASQRVDVRRREIIKEGVKDDAVAVANRTEVKVVKNKVAPPHKSAEITIVYGKGIDREQDLVDSAIEMGIINKGGAWYTYGDKRIQGYDALAKLLQEDQDLKEEIEKKVRESI